MINSCIVKVCNIYTVTSFFLVAFGFYFLFCAASVSASVAASAAGAAAAGYRD